ncbi:MAG: amidohydrolase [Acidobacteria bacterium]|nr:amidohydrolase [Acidobacteriota bacterium]
MRIWDLHCHPSTFGSEDPDKAMTDVIRTADRMQVERLCIYLGSLRHQDPNPVDLRAHNDWVLRAMKPFPDRVFGFAYINPNYMPATMEEIERCIRDGPMVGVKLWVAKRCNAPELDTIVSRCAELKAVIFQHTWIKTNGNLPGESTPMELAELAGRHPRVPIICGHTGGQWESGIRAVRARRNVSIDLAGSDPTNGFTEMAYRELGPDRIIYGSDSGGRSMASQLAKVHGAVIPEGAKPLIFAENLRRMMTPILTAKGIKT